MDFPKIPGGNRLKEFYIFVHTDVVFKHFYIKGSRCMLSLYELELIRSKNREKIRIRVRISGTSLRINIYSVHINLPAYYDYCSPGHPSTNESKL